MPEPWTWKDRITVYGSLALIVVLVFLPFLDQRIRHYQRIENRVAKWATDYELSSEQIKKITVIEKEFHRHELPLAIGIPPSAEREDLHVRDIAAVMGDEHSERFLLRELSRRQSQDH